MTAHYIEIETGGRLFAGYASHPKPEVPCCVKAVRAFSVGQAVEGTAHHEAGHAVAMMLAAGVQCELLWLVGRGLLTPERAWAAEVGGLDDQGIARDIACSVGWELDYEPSPIELPWNYPSQQVRALRVLAERWAQISAVAGALAQHRALTSEDLERLAG
ncbi:hypothetical protein OG735_08670 [Streptomyces sp. NBC_01210]|uniref:hypothetical protein n=1 Tax=Streptomyces sp. NBC_01210 TaxID=2903774 RepID=UPI002E11BCBB|nr:hypothetical protein OG735_08670 [Streptomyces sp. NBC_01210]